MSLALAVGVTGVSIASSQSMLMDVMTRHGVELPGGSYERAFDEGMRPSTPVNPGSFATPLALMTSATGGDRIDAAYAFGILAGHSGRAASPQELAAAGQALAQMIAAEDRRTRIAGARVTGRIFAVPFEARSSAVTTPGLADALFALFNRPSEIEQLAAMDALGLLREVSAVASLTERYQFYREGDKRALAGGALEALARIGDPSSVRDRQGRDDRAVGRGPRRHGTRGGVCPRAIPEGRIDCDHSAGGARSQPTCAGARAISPSSVSPLRDSAG